MVMLWLYAKVNTLQIPGPEALSSQHISQFSVYHSFAAKRTIRTK